MSSNRCDFRTARRQRLNDRATKSGAAPGDHDACIFFDDIDTLLGTPVSVAVGEDDVADNRVE
jgi:hypothetical protein